MLFDNEVQERKYWEIENNMKRNSEAHKPELKNKVEIKEKMILEYQKIERKRINSTC